MSSFVRHLALFQSRITRAKAEIPPSYDEKDYNLIIADASSSDTSIVSVETIKTSVRVANTNPPEVASKSEHGIAAKLKPTQSSPVDSEYGSQPDIDNKPTPAEPKHKMLRQLRAQLSVKCKRIWHDASGVMRRKNGHPEVKIEEKEEEETEDADDNDASEDEDEDDSGPRCEFDIIEAVEDNTLTELVMSHCNLKDENPHAEVLRRCKGAYNFVAIVNVSCGDETRAYVVRIPGHATLSHWTSEDEYMMEREVQLITHIRNNTSAPVAEVIYYSTNHENALGFPYILMTALPGKPAHSIWHDGDYDNDDLNLIIQRADMPSTATEKKRITFLRSLAGVMAGIQNSSFEQGGMAVFTEGESPLLGPMYSWAGDGSDKARQQKAFRWTSQYALPSLTKHNKEDLTDAHRGAYKFFWLVFNQAVFKPARPETFTIHHNDFNLQNILVDDDGNVTGIIDWDGAFIAPRCMGAAAAPLFLQKDWMPEHLDNLETGPHMAWKTPYYREIYASALMEAGCSDAIYTTKSPIYSAALEAVQQDTMNSMIDLIDKLLRETPHVRVKSLDFRRSLDFGWEDAEDMLMVELAKILEPELPRADLLEEIDAEMILKEWYLAFNLQEDEEDDDETDDDEDDEEDGSSN